MGVGAALLQAAEARIAAIHGQAWLAVVPGNIRARDFYERHGWRDTGELDLLVRALAIPRFLVDELAAHVAGRDPSDLAFSGVKGGALRAQGFQRAVLTDTAAGLGLASLHPRALRHTAASLAIASGANIKVVQKMLGHKSATMTLDLYSHLFQDQLDEVADRMERRSSSPATPIVPKSGNASSP